MYKKGESPISTFKTKASNAQDDCYCFLIVQEEKVRLMIADTLSAFDTIAFAATCKLFFFQVGSKFLLSNLVMAGKAKELKELDKSPPLTVGKAVTFWNFQNEMFRWGNANPFIQPIYGPQISPWVSDPDYPHVKFIFSLFDNYQPVLVTQQGRIFNYGPGIICFPHKARTNEFDLALIPLDDDIIISIFKAEWYVFFVSKLGIIYYRNFEVGKENKVERLDIQIARNEGIKDIIHVNGQNLFLTRRGKIFQWTAYNKIPQINVPHESRIKSMYFDNQLEFSLFLGFDGELFAEMGLDRKHNIPLQPIELNNLHLDTTDKIIAFSVMFGRYSWGYCISNLFLLSEQGRLFKCKINDPSFGGLHQEISPSLIFSAEEIRLPLEPGDKVKSLHMGEFHGYVLTDFGCCFGRGTNAYGQLGLLQDTRNTNDIFINISLPFFNTYRAHRLNMRDPNFSSTDELQQIISLAGENHLYSKKYIIRLLAMLPALDSLKDALQAPLYESLQDHNTTPQEKVRTFKALKLLLQIYSYFSDKNPANKEFIIRHNDYTNVLSTLLLKSTITLEELKQLLRNTDKSNHFTHFGFSLGRLSINLPIERPNHTYQDLRESFLSNIESDTTLLSQLSTAASILLNAIRISRKELYSEETSLIAYQ